MVPGYDNIAFGIALLHDTIAFPNRDRGSSWGPEPNGDNADARLASSLCRCEDVLGRLERLAVAEDDNCAIAATLCRNQKISALTNRAGQ